MNLLELYELLEIIFEKEIIAYKINQGYELDDELDEDELEELLYEHCDMNFDQLEMIIERLIPLCAVDNSPLTGNWYQGFAKDYMWIIKRKV